jgi:hypothetical protein
MSEIKTPTAEQLIAFFNAPVVYVPEPEPAPIHRGSLCLWEEEGRYYLEAEGYLEGSAYDRFRGVVRYERSFRKITYTRYEILNATDLRMALTASELKDKGFTVSLAKALKARLHGALASRTLLLSPDEPNLRWYAAQPAEVQKRVRWASEDASKTPRPMGGFAPSKNYEIKEKVKMCKDEFGEFEDCGDPFDL